MCHQVENSLLTDIMATDVEHCIRVCPLSSMMYMQIWLHLLKVIMSPHMLGALSLCNIAYRHDEMRDHLTQKLLGCGSDNVYFWVILFTNKCCKNGLFLQTPWR